MNATVIIPTHARPERIGACLRHLRAQSHPVEVLVGLDGEDPEAARACADAHPEARVVTCPRVGYNGVRNLLLEEASGELLLSANDDVLPGPDWVRAHVDAHREAESRLGGPVTIVGHSPFVRHDDESLFDRLVNETSMIFFWDAMIEDRWHDQGFRHCYGLNFSARRDLVRDVGAFTSFERLYGYDDIELAWRLHRAHGAPVLFRPEALAPHDHRYAPAEVLDREERLGVSAWAFASERPEFCLDLFGRDIRSDAELDYASEFVAREASEVARHREVFLALGRQAPEVPEALLPALLQQHRMLKRWHWRTGLLRGAGRA
ncbi:MAG: glycosyltransferase family 2 protein [Phycisphaerales bacterium]|nr:glycosyltransferase family 2 protein [Phycisphaerales bacterium]